MSVCSVHFESSCKFVGGAVTLDISILKFSLKQLMSSMFMFMDISIMLSEAIMEIIYYFHEKWKIMLEINEPTKKSL